MALTAKKLDTVRPTVPVADAGTQDLVRINLNVSKTTRCNWKKAAIDRQITVAQLINVAVTEYLSK